MCRNKLILIFDQIGREPISTFQLLIKINFDTGKQPAPILIFIGHTGALIKMHLHTHD